ncbi:hypothetical protein ABE288_22525 [Bacillus salipaludis]|uniref:hypothetical protein n=1 Tax=Bacillus salipaludis TaxID=2547811 RepID=UPI003D224189
MLKHFKYTNQGDKDKLIKLRVNSEFEKLLDQHIEKLNKNPFTKTDRSKYIRELILNDILG